MKNIEYEILAKEKHGDKFDYSLIPKEFNIRNDKINIICPIHGTFEIIPRDHLRSVNGCRKCGNIMHTRELKDVVSDFIKKSTIKFKNRFIYYPNEDSIVLDIRCPLHGIFKSNIKRHYHSKTGCPMCGKIKNMETRYLFNNTSDVLDQCKIKHGVLYKYKTDLLSPIPLTSDILLIECVKHGEFPMSIRSHVIENRICRKCSYEKYTFDFETFVKKSQDIHGDDYIYYKDSYVNTNENTKIKHLKCNKIFTRKARKHLEGQKCPHCKYSKGEEKLIDFLIKFNIEYEREFRIGTDRKRYDFYLPKLNILLEYDGEQHYRPIKAWGGDVRFKKQKSNDRHKNKLAKKSNIPLIRISYKNYNNMEFFLKNKLLILKKVIDKNKYYDILVEKLLLC